MNGGRASLSAGFWGGAEGAWMEILTKECIYDPCAFLYVYTELKGFLLFVLRLRVCFTGRILAY